MRQRWTIPAVVALMAVAVMTWIAQGTGRAAQMPTAGLTIHKSVAPEVIAPGRTVLYTVELSNTTETTQVVSSLVDVMPEDFEYAGLAPGSDWTVEPWDQVGPEIRWAGPITVPISGTMELRYWVYVPDSVPLRAEPYTNTVTATVGAETYQAQAGLHVAVGTASIVKTASPPHVEPGGNVTYTISLSNSGYAPLRLASVTDTLPVSVTFSRMTTDSDVTVAPMGLTGTITWTGPLTIPARAELQIRYVVTMPRVSETLHLENRAWGRLESGETVGPAGAEVNVSTGPTIAFLPLLVRNWAPAAFEITKSADPTEAYAQEGGTPIEYTVTLRNIGTETGVLGDVRDTLPTGFTFVQMLPGSDVTANPDGTTGEIVWTGPFTLTGGSSLTIKYRVQSGDQVGTYVNSATATVKEGYPIEAPAAATIELKEPYLLIEEFENPSPYWEEFLNYWRLNDQQWHYKPGGGDDGSQALGHTFWLGVDEAEDGAHDALIMYKGPGAEQWTDYVFQTRAVLFFGDGTGRGKFGVWFRGTANQENQPPGRYVTGYYLTLQPGPPMVVDLWQMRTDEECGDDCDYNYHFSNPLLLARLRGREDLDPLGLSIDWGRWYWIRVEVQGSRIRCYIDDVLVFDYNDTVGTTFTSGTVGFYTYIAGDARFDHVSVKPLE